MVVKAKFENEKKTRTFRRIDDEHQLDIFLGYNEEGKPTMIIIVGEKEVTIESSRSIEVKLFKRDDSRLSISFSLLDISMEAIFYKFCEDIIESSRSINKLNALNYIVGRWNSWRLMFKKNANELLNENQISGLLGELIFLKEYMIPKYGESVAIKSWMGPEKSHKDFEVEDTWYEIKTIRSGALTIKISSVEQLDSESLGHLNVVILEKTNEKCRESVSLNNYINGLQEMLDEFENELIFRNKLGQVGYCYDEEYDKYNYRFIENKRYAVNENFPRIEKENLPNAIVKASYDILINEIQEYIEMGD
ncbi:PD-(D/E)XK motif protein [Clostridium diolis]|nr:PD-(D/E)XK motif protein [Clostridium diolis]